MRVFKLLTSINLPSALLASTRHVKPFLQYHRESSEYHATISFEEQRQDHARDQRQERRFKNQEWHIHLRHHQVRLGRPCVEQRLQPEQRDVGHARHEDDHLQTRHHVCTGAVAALTTGQCSRRRRISLYQERYIKNELKTAGYSSLQNRIF